MKRPALGHLLGYTALTVILTAGAAQSLTGTNTVDSGDIVDGTISAADLKTGAVTGSKILDGTVTGTDIADGTIRSADVGGNSLTGLDIADGTVRSPDVLDNSLTGADINESTLVLTCPSGTNRIGDVCYTAEYTAATLNSAWSSCPSLGMRVPTASEAALVGSVVGGSELWTDAHYYDTTNRGVTTNGSTTSWHVDAATAHVFRCVTTIGAQIF